MKFKCVHFSIKFFKSFFVDENEEKSVGKFPRFNSQIIDLEKKIQKVMETSINFNQINRGSYYLIIRNKIRKKMIIKPKVKLLKRSVKC